LGGRNFCLPSLSAAAEFRANKVGAPLTYCKPNNNLAPTPTKIENTFAIPETTSERFQFRLNANLYQIISIRNTPNSTGIYGAFCTRKKYMTRG